MRQVILLVLSCCGSYWIKKKVNITVERLKDMRGCNFPAKESTAMNTDRLSADRLSKNMFNGLNLAISDEY